MSTRESIVYATVQVGPSECASVHAWRDSLESEPRDVHLEFVLGPGRLVAADGPGGGVYLLRLPRALWEAMTAEAAADATEVECPQAQPSASAPVAALPMLTDADLAEIRARHAAATPGVWEVLDAGSHGYINAGIGKKRTTLGDWEGAWDPPDALFAAHAHQDIPRLLAEIDRLRNPPAPPVYTFLPPRSAPMADEKVPTPALTEWISGEELVRRFGPTALEEMDRKGLVEWRDGGPVRGPGLGQWALPAGVEGRVRPAKEHWPIMMISYETGAVTPVSVEEPLTLGQRAVLVAADEWERAETETFERLGPYTEAERKLLQAVRVVRTGR